MTRTRRRWWILIIQHTINYHTHTSTERETPRFTGTEGHSHTLRGTNLEEDPEADDTVTQSQISDTKYLS